MPPQMFRAISVALGAALIWVALVMLPTSHTIPSAPAQGTPIPAQTDAAAQYVGRQVCAQCHPAQHALWQGSHHDLAMQDATAQTVLGNFD
jgi:mono/diheme cytochrome c family protein